MMRPTALFFSLALGLTSAQRGWKLIAKDIGGGPLGVACFEDGQTCVSETSHILPFPGYETIESLDGGATWAQVPDQDGILGVLALYNVAASGTYAVVSAEASIQWSSDRGHNFTAAAGPAGGEIVRKLFAADGSVSGFAILGETTDGNTVGLVASNISADGGKSFAPINIGELDPGILSIDGSFSSTSWTVCGNEYVTAAAHARARSRIQQRMLQRKHRRPAPVHAVASAAAAYHTQVVVSRDAGVTWNTVFRNNSVAALGIACIDAAQQSCCFVSEDGDYAYIHCTTDGWATAHEALADKNEGAALVEVAVSTGTNGTTCYVAAGGYVTGAGQSPVFYRSCDAGASWAKDPLPAWPVANLLATDIDCVPSIKDGSGCWATLWDDGGFVIPNGFVARYAPA